MFMCCTKKSFVINLIYSGQQLFSYHIWETFANANFLKSYVKNIFFNQQNTHSEFTSFSFYKSPAKATRVFIQEGKDKLQILPLGGCMSLGYVCSISPKMIHIKCKKMTTTQAWENINKIKRKIFEDFWQNLKAIKFCALL